MANGIIWRAYCWTRSAVKGKAPIPESITIINNPFCVYDENGALPTIPDRFAFGRENTFRRLSTSNAVIDGFYLEVMLYAQRKRTDYNLFLNEK